MIYIYSFLFAGAVCLIAELILDNTKLTPGHITSLFVIIGAALDIFDIYDLIVAHVGAGALVPITSFGHLLIHGGLVRASEVGYMGLAMGVSDLTASGITSAIFFAFIFSLFFRPKD